MISFKLLYYEVLITINLRYWTIYHPQFKLEGELSRYSHSSVSETSYQAGRALGSLRLKVCKIQIFHPPESYPRIFSP